MLRRRRIQRDAETTNYCCRLQRDRCRCDDGDRDPDRIEGRARRDLVVNLAILGAFGTFTAMGEEIGWRGYLQPRLDAAGLRSSVIVVWLIQVAYHVPLMLGAEYVNVGSFTTSVTIFTIGDLAFTFIAARESYLARSLWPAVFLHSFHNTISQWLFPTFFSVAAGQLWIQAKTAFCPWRHTHSSASRCTSPCEGAVKRGVAYGRPQPCAIPRRYRTVASVELSRDHKCRGRRPHPCTDDCRSRSRHL